MSRLRWPCGGCGCVPRGANLPQTEFSAEKRVLGPRVCPTTSFPPPPAPRNRRSVGELVPGELVAEDLLGELPYRRLRHLVDEHDVVGKPPLGHPGPQEL